MSPRNTSNESANEQRLQEKLLKLGTDMGYSARNTSSSTPKLKASKQTTGCGCVVLIALTIVGILAVSAIGATLKPSTVPTSQPPVYATVAPAIPARALSILLDIQGAGTKTTQTFTVGDTWDMAWAYNCASFSDGSGNFIVNVMTPNGQLSSNGGTNQLGTSANDIEHFHQGGTFYLEINSECSWHVKVAG